MTVADLDRRMSHREFVAWQVFHARKAQRRELAEKKAQKRR